MKYLPFVSSSTLFIAACASAAYWGLPWFQPAAAPVVVTQPARPAPPDIAAAAGLFGGAPAGPAVTAYQLKGVIEDGPDGVAILVADGKPAQAVGIGQEVAPGVRVTEVHQRYVLLNDGGAVKRLELPEAGIPGLELVASITVAKSGGPMPLPAAAPNIGQTQQQIMVKQRAEYMQHIRQMQEHRPSGIGPGAFGPPPTS